MSDKNVFRLDEMGRKTHRRADKNKYRITFVGRGQFPLMFLCWFKCYPETIHDTTAISRSLVPGSDQIDGHAESMFENGRHVTVIREQELTIAEDSEIRRYGWSMLVQLKIK